MPIVPPALGNPYPSVGSVMNVARARVDDMINDVDGDLLTNDAPYTQTYLSAAWRWYQDQCSTRGVETFRKDTFLMGIPARSTEDTANPCWLTWLGCSDGVYQYESPALPQDMIQPLTIWRRDSGTTSDFKQPMALAEDGLPTWLDQNVYAWNDDGVYFYGAPQAQDLRLRYDAYRPDLNALAPTTLVPMMRCEDCLGARVAYEYASARGSAQAQQMMQWAQDAFENGAAKRTSRRKQRATFKRQPYNRRGSAFCDYTFPQYINNT